MPDITADELKQRIAEGNTPVLIDVREPYEHEEFNIGGKNLPMGELQQWQDDLDQYKDSDLVLYCRTGNRSQMAVAFLQAKGKSNVYNLIGGVEDWK